MNFLSNILISRIRIKIRIFWVCILVWLTSTTVRRKINHSLNTMTSKLAKLIQKKLKSTLICCFRPKLSPNLWSGGINIWRWNVLIIRSRSLRRFIIRGRRGWLIWRRRRRRTGRFYWRWRIIKWKSIIS